MNPASLTLGRTGYEPSLLLRKEGRPDCVAGADVNGDGRTDLTCQFLVKLAGFLPGDRAGLLRGLTGAGIVVEARDNVRIVP